MIFLLSLLVSMGVLERAGAGVKYTLLHGATGGAAINGYLLFFSMFICVLLFILGFALYRHTLIKGLKHMLGVSIYLNFVTLTIMLSMLIIPLVKLRF